MRVYLTLTAASLDADADCGADAWVLDPAQAAAPDVAARAAGGGRPLLFRLRGLPTLTQDLDAASRPAAILLPVAHGRDVAHAGALLAVHEARHGWSDGGTRIVALVAEAAGALNLASQVDSSPRLAGIAWDAGGLAAELSAGAVDAAGGWIAPLAQARALVRLAAAAAGVEAIETLRPPGREPGLHARAALRDGFGAMFAGTHADVAAIRSASL